MQDDEGNYIGVPDCKYYMGVTHWGERVCCGGKGHAKISFIQCQVRGILEAEKGCTMYLCNKYDGKHGKKS